MGLFFVCLLRRHFRFAIARAESFSQERWKRKFKNKMDFGKKGGRRNALARGKGTSKE